MSNGSWQATKSLSAAAAIIGLTALSTPALAQVGLTADKVVIGALGVLTGPYAIYGKNVYNGVEVVYKDANEAGGVHGRRIEYVREDDRCSPADAVAAAKKLIHEHKVFMIHGGACSNASVAAKPEIVAAKVPWVITASSVDSLTEPMDPNIFSTMTAGWMDTYGQLEYALKQGAKKIAIVSQRDTWGQERRALLQKALADRGLRPVADEELPPEPTDATAVVLKVQQAQPDAVIAILYPKAGATYLRDAFKVGFQPLTVGPPPLSDVESIAKQVGIPGAADKLVGMSPLGFSPTDPKMAVWREKIAKYYPDDTFTIYHMLGIASGQFVVEALRRAGPDLTREKVVEVMANLTIPTDTLGGPLSCRPDDRQCHRSPTLFGLKDGKAIPMGSVTLSRR